MTVQRNPIISGTAVLMASSLLNACISILTTSLIAREIGPELYGRYTFGLTYIMVFLGLATFGLEAVYVRDAATDKSKIPLIMDVLHLRAMIGVVFICGAVLFGHILKYSHEVQVVIYILCVGLFFQILYESLLGVYKCREQMHIVALASTSLRILTALVIVVSIYAGIGFYGIVSAFSIGNALIFCSLFAWFYKELHLVHFQLKPAIWIELIRKGTPFYTAGILTVLYSRIGLLILAKSVPEYDLGLYMAAQALVESLWFVPIAFQTTLFPAFSRIYGSSPETLGRTYDKAMKYLLILTVGACVGTMLVAEPVIDLMFGSKFYGAAPVLRTLICYWALVTVSQTQASLLCSIRGEVLQAKVMVIAMAIMVSLSFLLIKLFGIAGAALALVITEGIVVAALSVILWRADLRFVPEGQLSLLGVTIVLMAIIVDSLLKINLVVAICAGAACYIGALFIFKIVTREERAVMRSLINPKFTASNF